MSNNKASEQKLKDCVAIEKGAPRFIVHSIYTIAATGLIYLVIFVVLGLMFLGVESLPGAHLGSRATIALAGGCTLPLALVLGFLLAKFKFGKFFAEYWQQNIVGYTMVFYRHRPDDEIETTILYGRNQTNTNSYGYHICLPLGGWFRRPSYHGTNSSYWKLRGVYSYHELVAFNPLKHSLLYLSDQSGSCLKLSPKKILENAPRHSDIDKYVIDLSVSLDLALADLGALRLRSLDDEHKHTTLTAAYGEQGKNFNDLVNTTIKTITEILKTSRFRDSKEGARIRRLLSDGVRQVLKLDDPRITGLAAIEESRLPKSRAKS